MKSGKNKIFKVVVTVAVVVLLSVTFFCSEKKEKTDQYRGMPKKSRSPEPVITKVEFQPSAPTSTDIIQVVPALADPARMKLVRFSYQWFVNGKIIAEQEDQQLEKQYYKKGDEVYCRVKATMGIHDSKVVKSKEIEVKNSGPIIHAQEIDKVQIPGRFSYTINAEDPDGDPLTYRLVSPLELGIQLNPETGEIVWDIPDIPGPEPSDNNSAAIVEGEENIPRGDQKDAASKDTPGEKKPAPLPPVLKIEFEVQDSDGANVVSSIQLDLRPGGGRPE